MYSKNLSELTDFLTNAAIHSPTRKLIKDTLIALTVNANALTLKPPLIIPHLRFLSSLLFLELVYL